MRTTEDLRDAFKGKSIVEMLQILKEENKPRFTTEKQFKDELRARLIAEGHKFHREVNVGDPHPEYGKDERSAAYVDFISAGSGAWFIECKLHWSTSSITKAIGQALYYRKLLPGFSPVICYASGDCVFSRSEDVLYELCGEHGIVLTNDIRLTIELEAFRGRPQDDSKITRHLRSIFRR